jgi:hypothetical protein
MSTAAARSQEIGERTTHDARPKFRWTGGRSQPRFRRLLAAHPGEASPLGPWSKVVLAYDSFKRARAPEQVALAELNAELPEMLQFSFALDAFGNDFSSQDVAEQFEAVYQGLL